MVNQMKLVGRGRLLDATSSGHTLGQASMTASVCHDASVRTTVTLDIVLPRLRAAAS
jgi:hypothetical protein